MLSNESDIFQSKINKKFNFIIISTGEIMI
jgi:hypothetical protein